MKRYKMESAAPCRRCLEYIEELSRWQETCLNAWAPASEALRRKHERVQFELEVREDAFVRAYG